MVNSRVEPWLVIIGLGEDGMAGLSAARQSELANAEIIFGGPRHLALADAGERGRPWPIPFSVEPVLAARGRKVVVLASGDPFWFGAGSLLAASLGPEEWIARPAPSTFSLAANRLGWRLEHAACMALHAAPFERLQPVLHNKQRVICLLRDAASAGSLAGWLSRRGFGASTLYVMEALGGPRERIRSVVAEQFAYTDIMAPVAVAIAVSGSAGLSHASGLPDTVFRHDGQITKRPVRALTLSALAPRPDELLWDIGAGSGSISLEWCLAGGRAIAVEARTERIANIQANARAFGLEPRMEIVEGQAPDALEGLPAPDAVFIGGGGSAALLDYVWDTLSPGTRIVANSVTLETETLLATWYGQKGGDLLRIELASAAPLGTMRGWVPARPIVQWSVTR
ncbi:cobalamin biosynthesis protein precorrin-6Y C5,15-methyltransferase [Acetobacter tropicalis NRIC 0312]|uniref:Precorrin-6Y methyltransferase n=1 Tax=Acetobacter tropicalis TaxID=104102 RepID=A0A511FR06_9PROT|nr:bifunctional cobalt-precorrin-7 (C(5))-methyltransferase/cobalt-precorrin-6B (C(15))-methyltransferase [Acetobacter tropicalis]KXV51311.1 precorrin-6Y methyltransferase [Acetobacter tropicalis]GAL99071.1 precorrin-6y methyltransferase [Acetobacter tropicalis]GBR69638.1 cobalamin biosynthesis protein precorrin-6Y C5,15-methyltransferase [Acetobacter tropicalis NRIC 0312]GEL51335.1 precorrin-6Y methyltransferase [Acetobacter tropicalis]